nr:rho-related GTP-binding protein RhoU [Columba livia]
MASACHDTLPMTAKADQHMVESSSGFLEMENYCLLDSGRRKNETAQLHCYSRDLAATVLLKQFSFFGLTTLFPAPSSFLSKAVVSVDGKPVRLQLCDTAGQDEFDKLRPLCYTNTDIFLLCFSVVSPSSFQNVSEKWVPEIRCHCPKAPIILVGTQSDLREDVKVLIELDKCKEKPVSEEAAKLCAEEIKAASYIECSALTQKNLKEVFDAAIVAGIQYSDTQQQPKKSKCRTPDKMKNLSKSWWKKYCCFV